MPWYRMKKETTIGGIERNVLYRIEHNRPLVEGVPCKRCRSERIVRFGSYKGVQRLLCRSCGVTFMDNDALPHMKVETKVIGSALHGFYEGHSLNAIRRQLRQDYGGFYPSDATLYRWVARFTPVGVGAIQGLRACVGPKWVADELMTPIAGKQTWIWDVMDANTRFLLASHISLTRTLRDAKKVFAKAKGAASEPPRIIVTDKLAAYIDGIERVFGADSRHVQSQGLRAEVNNNLSERLQGTIRQRTKVMRGMQNKESAELFLNGWALHYNFFRQHEGLGNRTPAEEAKVKAPFANWTEVVEYYGKR